MKVRVRVHAYAERACEMLDILVKGQAVHTYDNHGFILHHPRNAVRSTPLIDVDTEFNL